MGFFDRFKPKHEKLEPKKPRHVVKPSKDDETKKAFAAVPAADRSGQVVAADKPAEAKPTVDKSTTPRGTESGSTRKSEQTPEAAKLATRVLLKPVITEKSSRLTVHRQYVFAVHPDANKLAVKRAVESAYGIRPTGVQMLNVRGRAVRYGRSTGRTKAWKKAVVTLPPGKSLTVYEG